MHSCTGLVKQTGNIMCVCVYVCAKDKTGWRSIDADWKVEELADS